MSYAIWFVCGVVIPSGVTVAVIQQVMTRNQLMRAAEREREQMIRAYQEEILRLSRTHRVGLRPEPRHPWPPMNVGTEARRAS